MMRLRHAPMSPFARKVVVALHELGLQHSVALVPTDVWDPATDLAADSPLAKIPVLLTDEGAFPGSTLICQYLDELAGPPRLIPREPGRRWETLRLHAFADGLMEAAVALVIERLRRPGPYVWQGNLDRQRAKVTATLDLLETWPDLAPGRVDLATITLACALAYLDLRLPELGWRDGRERLAAFGAAWSARPSMRATAPAPPPPAR
jgi:glutathione S-transferase